MKMPGDWAVAVGEFGAVIAEEILHGSFVIGEVAEFSGMFEGELQRGERVVEAVDAEGAETKTRWT